MKEREIGIFFLCKSGRAKNLSTANKNTYETRTENELWWRRDIGKIIQQLRDRHNET